MKQRIPMVKPLVPKAETRRVMPPPKRAEDVYGTAEYAWWRDEVLTRANGLCQDPEHAGRRVMGARLYPDHIVEMRDGGAPYDINNGMARCASCHGKKTLRERAKRMGGG